MSNKRFAGAGGNTKLTPAQQQANVAKQDELERKKEEEKQREIADKLKPKHTMEQLEKEAELKAPDMSSSELDQFQRVDAKYRNMQNYQFETLLREICAECIEPLRKRVISNNEQIASMTKESLVHADKIDKLEIVYFNKDQAIDPLTGLTRPTNIFDTINNKLADNATISRQNEQAL